MTISSFGDFLKRTVLLLAAAALALTLVSCSKEHNSSNDNGNKEQIVTSDGEGAEQDEKFNTDGFETVVEENSFAWLYDYFFNSSHESVYVATLSCLKPTGAEEGIYGCEELSVKVDGESVRQSLCYLQINGDVAAINISFFDDFVEEGSVIEISAENFNELNYPPAGESQTDYSDVSDVTVFEGNLEIEVRVAEDFGYLLFEEVEGCESVIVTDSVLQFAKSQKLFGKEPTKDSVKLVMSDGSEVSYDNCYIFHEVDEDGNNLEQFDVMFSFEDENKTIDLALVSEIVFEGENLIA